MNKKRTIIIKDPRLRKIRDNFRDLIISACSAEKSKIHDEKERLMKNKDFFENEKYRKLSKELNDQYWAVERPLRASILYCHVCGKTNKGMTYNPVRKTWYCTECYEVLKKGFIEEGRLEEFP